MELSTLCNPIGVRARTSGNSVFLQPNVSSPVFIKLSLCVKCPQQVKGESTFGDVEMLCKCFSARPSPSALTAVRSHRKYPATQVVSSSPEAFFSLHLGIEQNSYLYSPSRLKPWRARRTKRICSSQHENGYYVRHFLYRNVTPNRIRVKFRYLEARQFWKWRKTATTAVLAHSSRNVHVRSRGDDQLSNRTY